MMQYALIAISGELKEDAASVTDSKLPVKLLVIQ
jgi:hypothetical protein